MMVALVYIYCIYRVFRPFRPPWSLRETPGSLRETRGSLRENYGLSARLLGSARKSFSVSQSRGGEAAHRFTSLKEHKPGMTVHKLKDLKA